MAQNARYRTFHEEKFLSKLGTYNAVSGPRVKLLKGYYKAAKERIRWGDMNPFYILGIVATEIGMAAPFPHEKWPNVIAAQALYERHRIYNGPTPGTKR